MRRLSGIASALAVLCLMSAASSPVLADQTSTATTAQGQPMGTPPGSQPIAPAGGQSLQGGVTGQPTTCPDGAKPDQNAKCPDPHQTTTGDGTNTTDQTMTNATPRPSMK